MDKELVESIKKYGTNDWGAGTPFIGTLLTPTHRVSSNSGKRNVDLCFAESGPGAV